MKEEHFITFAICVVVIVVVGAVVTADLLSRKARLECYQVVGNRPVVEIQQLCK